jgi:hypothetical protein
VSLLGFRAFGTSVGDNVLLAFEQGPTHWVVTMANAMVVVHVAAAYQVGATGVCIVFGCRGLAFKFTIGRTAAD